MMMQEAPEETRNRSRLFIAPRAHNMLGYHEGIAEHPELHHSYSVATNLEMLLHWYDTVRKGEIHESGPIRNAWFKDPDGNIHGLSNMG